ncbi:hypothetical protein Cgig2_034185 [Carnegiea gigantea]|uniref:Uncharacterized protein n=1 Tax=Carnegiea gigantea TaxID=171969 RepID=A0A9Q1GS92_9CARY|nr:hypothetical protein Cgig2_034185 [Carnegiea gigantea]
MSDVNFMADHDVSIENLRHDLGHYEDIDVNILDVSETRGEEENDEEEDDEVEAEDEEFEDFISDEDEELAVGDMCLDDSEDEDDDPNSDDDETLKDTFKEVRKKPDKRPQWLDEAIWKELWAYWNSDTFKKKSDAAKLNRASTTVDENKRQKIELDSQKKVLDDVQAKLTLEQAKSKKQTKKVHKYAKATQDIQAQMFQWHSLMKTILPNLPPPIPVIDSLSESEDGGEDENDDGGGGGGGGGVDE